MDKYRYTSDYDYTGTDTSSYDNAHDHKNCRSSSGTYRSSSFYRNISVTSETARMKIQESTIDGSFVQFNKRRVNQTNVEEQVNTVVSKIPPKKPDVTPTIAGFTPDQILYIQ